MTITEDEIMKALIAWGDGIVSVSRAYENKGFKLAKRVATKTLEDLYGFEFGPILFKPTLSGGEKTFRTTKAGALSYFIGGNAEYPFDSGFGIQCWRKVWFKTSATFKQDCVALWMGWMMFENKEGVSIKVDKSFGYKKSRDGVLKIILHHSSLPYQHTKS